jgi:hypothetical protein
MAKSAPASCSSCGFLTAIGGSLGQVFGVCANEFGAADGQVVALTYGCGAHSSVRAETKAPVPIVGLVVDDISDDLEDGTDLPDYIANADEVEPAETYDRNDDAYLLNAISEDDFHDATIMSFIESIED